MLSNIMSKGEEFSVEKVAFKDWHESLHHFYLISDRLSRIFPKIFVIFVGIFPIFLAPDTFDETLPYESIID